MRKYWRVDSNVFQVSRIALDDHYPNFPLTYFTSDLDEARRTCIPIDTIPTMAPIHGAGDRRKSPRRRTSLLFNANGFETSASLLTRSLVLRIKMALSSTLFTSPERLLTFEI